MFRTLALASLLTALTAPLFAQNTCTLEMTMSCASGTCTSVTKNSGTNACSGDYAVGFYSAAPSTKFANFTNSLGLTAESCLNSDQLGGTSTQSFVICIGPSSLAAGASFTAKFTHRIRIFG